MDAEQDLTTKDIKHDISLMNYQAYCCYIGNTNILTYITFIFETYFFSLTLLISSDIKKLSLSFVPFRHPAELR